MTLEELRKLASTAEQAMTQSTNPPMEWNDYDFCQEVIVGEWAAYVRAFNPRTVLKLLEMIQVLRAALEEGMCFDPGCDSCPPVRERVDRADEIERSL